MESGVKPEMISIIDSLINIYYSGHQVVFLKNLLDVYMCIKCALEMIF